MNTARRLHGGPDAAGVPAHDFSTNANACGPCPRALQIVRDADRARYPEPSYTVVRACLALLHGVSPERIVLAGSASEFIARITFAAALRGVRRVRVPRHAYGDYAQAAQACRLDVTVCANAGLAWLCDPSNPLGCADEGLAEWERQPVDNAGIVVLDRAYEPLRLTGELAVPAASLDRVWQLFSPNKALGMTGVRAAYAVAPAESRDDRELLEALCPSWPLGADGTALLHAWCEDEVQGWLRSSLQTLRVWKHAQEALCAALGLRVLPSVANFFCVDLREATPEPVAALARLRARGVKLRDCESFGLPGRARLAVLPPSSQEALRNAWR